MSEFELSTLAVLALLLLAVGAYSYWQIHRAEKAQEAAKARLAEQAVEPPSQHRYPAYAPEPEPLPETWPTAPASVQTESSVDEHPADVAASVSASVSEPVQEALASLEPESKTAPVLTTDESIADEATPSSADSALMEAEPVTVSDTASTEDEVSEPVPMTAAEQAAERVRVQAALVQMSPVGTSATAPQAVSPQTNSPSATDSASPASSLSSAVSTSSAECEPTMHSATPTERMSVLIAEPPNSKAPLTFDLDEAEEKQRIAQRINAQEIKRRATWEVFAPFARFEHWLHTAHPQGVDPIRAIDAEIVIAVNQPKTAEDIERALYDLRLDTPLPLRLMGVRAGQISMTSGAKKEWQDLQAGAPYCAIKLSLQLANRSHCAQEELIQRWFGFAEALRKRLAGHIDTLPDVYELSHYAQFLHALARRVGQPIILQLHKENGLWPAYEVHQQLTACGATLIERGIYIARNERNTPMYAVMNDVNNPRAQDFFRNQLAVMYVHTLSFCVELARIELRLEDETELEPIQRLLGDMQSVADALGAQWQNQVGEEIALDELAKIAHEQTRIFARQLSALGLPVGALMTKRLLLG